MFTQVKIRNFQSLKKVDLDLGLFTVIVGASSTGKSAMIRAFRALASNVRGSSVITRGQKQMAISVTNDQGVTVTLERSDRSGSYRIAGDGAHQFAKLAGEVPPQVSAQLRLDPGPDSVNFASQFDKPYLLDESGATVARQLGELTNVNVIFEAVRLANKIRNSTTATLKTRTADLDNTKAQIHQFSGLFQQLQQLQDASTLDATRKALQDRVQRLQDAILRLRQATEVLERQRPAQLPDTAALTDTLAKVQDLTGMVNAVWSVEKTAALRLQDVRSHQIKVRDLDEALTVKLAEVKLCPTCGQQLP